MKVSIGYRLFLATMLSVATVAMAGVELVRWKLADNPPQHAANVEPDPTGALIATLAAQYRQRHDWAFLPADSAMRKSWLREALMRSREDRDSTSGKRLFSPTFGYRIGLLDRHRHYLAGVIASPAMVALASIDTLERPVVVDGEMVGYLVVARAQDPDDELAIAFLIEQQQNLLIIAAIGISLSALAAALLAAHFRRPIGLLVDGARRLGDGEFDTRLRLRRRDELGELAATFNQLAVKLEEAERSRRQWVANTSHELRTPLSVLRGQVEALQDGVRTATPDNLALMLRQTLTLTKLVDDLYDLARGDVGHLPCHKSASDVWSLVLDVLEGFAEKIRLAGLIATVGTTPGRSIVYCDADRIRQVLTNLLENCVRYTAAGGSIEATGIVVDNELRIAIDDSAPGVDGPSIERMGERFFRAESSRSRQFGGAGLGLAISKQIAEAHAGRLTFGPSPLGGLRATLVLALED